MSNSLLLGPFEASLFEWVDRIFSDPEISRTVTWHLYQGRDEDGPITKDISIQAVCTKDVASKADSAENKVGIQIREREYILKLPSGTTLGAFNLNDRFTDGTGEYVVTLIDKSLGFVFKVTASGDQ